MSPNLTLVIYVYNQIIPDECVLPSATINYRATLLTRKFAIWKGFLRLSHIRITVCFARKKSFCFFENGPLGITEFPPVETVGISMAYGTRASRVRDVRPGFWIRHCVWFAIDCVAQAAICRAGLWLSRNHVNPIKSPTTVCWVYDYSAS